MSSPHIPRRIGPEDNSNIPPGLTYSPDGTRIDGEEDIFSKYDGQAQPQIKARLEQIRYFLADADCIRDSTFKDKLQECRGYLRHLVLGNKAGEGYSANMIYILKQRVALHERWMRDREEAAEVDFDDQVQHETPESVGRLLPQWWQAHPSSVGDQLDGLGLVRLSSAAEAPDFDSPVEAKTHETDEDVEMVDRPPDTSSWLHNTSSPAHSRSPIRSSPPAPARYATHDDILPNVRDAWHYTKAVENVNREIMAYALTKYREADTTFDLEGNEISPFAWNPMPTNFLQPFYPPSAEHLLSSWTETRDKLKHLLHQLLEVEHRTTRPLLSAICNTLVDEIDEAEIAEQKAVTEPNPEAIANRYLLVKDFKLQEYEDLKIFTREARYKRISQYEMAWRGPELTFAQAVEALRDNYPDFWPKEGDEPIPAGELIAKCREITAKPPYPRVADARCIEILWAMRDQNRIQIFRERRPDGSSTGDIGIGSPRPNDFPEARLGLSQDVNYWNNIASRIVKAYRILDKNLQQYAADPLYMKTVVLPDFMDNLCARTRLWEHHVGFEPLAQKWVNLARPLEEARKRDTLSVQRARELLMQRLLDESALAREQKVPRSVPRVWNWNENKWYSDSGALLHHLRWDRVRQNEGQEMRNLMELETRDQMRADANRGEKGVRFSEQDPGMPESERKGWETPAEDNYFAGRRAFFPLPETEVVDAVVQEEISAHRPRLTEVEREREMREEARREEARRNAERNKRRPGDEEDDDRVPSSRTKFQKTDSGRVDTSSEL